MLKNIFSIYTLLVCFVCILIFIFVSSSISNSLIDHQFPQYDASVDIYETNESYLEHNPKAVHLFKEPPEQLTKTRLAKKEAQLKKIPFDAERNIIHLLPLLFLSILFFIIHWDLYRRQWRVEAFEEEKRLTKHSKRS